MVANNFSAYVEYFRALTEQHLQLKDFIHGTAADIMGKTRSEISYPCLWLETPQMKLTDNSASQFTGIRSGAFIILYNAPGATPPQVDLIWELTEQICLEVLGKMRQDKKKHLLSINFNSATLDPISTLFIDNDYGWRVEFTLEKQINICHNPTKWKSE